MTDPMKKAVTYVAWFGGILVRKRLVYFPAINVKVRESLVGIPGDCTSSPPLLSQVIMLPPLPLLLILFVPPQIARVSHSIPLHTDSFHSYSITIHTTNFFSPPFSLLIIIRLVPIFLLPSFQSPFTYKTEASFLLYLFLYFPPMHCLSLSVIR